MISMTFADDAGEYTIVIRNKHGETSASASLLEEGKRSWVVSVCMIGKEMQGSSSAMCLSKGLLKYSSSVAGCLRGYPLLASAI